MQVLVDPIPEVRAVAARALGSLISGMGEEIFPDLVPWLLDTLKSDNSNVERSGAAQGLSEVGFLFLLAFSPFFVCNIAFFGLAVCVMFYYCHYLIYS